MHYFGNTLVKALCNPLITKPSRVRTSRFNLIHNHSRKTHVNRIILLKLVKQNRNSYREGFVSTKPDSEEDRKLVELGRLGSKLYRDKAWSN